ncbi:hypothetical protein HY230_04455, partial [Candidatus Acetothermia bacterium]|nr:hypothetical protein [Candidatus Acetothermia bacterium]
MSTVKRVLVGAGLALVLGLSIGAVFSMDAQAQQGRACFAAPPPLQPEEPLEMNSVVVNNLVKTVKMEKEVFECGPDVNPADGNPDSVDTIRDVELFTEILEFVGFDDQGNFAVNRFVSPNPKKTFEVVICDKLFNSAAVPGISIACNQFPIPTAQTFELVNCHPAEQVIILDPVEMNTVVTRRFIKTIKAEKEIFECGLPGTNKRVIVDVNLFTEIFEFLNGQLFKKFFEATICVKDPSSGSPGKVVLGCRVVNVPPLAADSAGTNVLSFLREPFALQRVKALRSTGERVEFVAEGSGIASIQVQIFNAAGRSLFSQEIPGDRLTWEAQDTTGRFLPNGVYFYVVTARG